MYKSTWDVWIRSNYHWKQFCKYNLLIGGLGNFSIWSINIFIKIDSMYAYVVKVTPKYVKNVERLSFIFQVIDFFFSTQSSEYVHIETKIIYWTCVYFILKMNYGGIATGFESKLLILKYVHFVIETNEIVRPNMDTRL